MCSNDNFHVGDFDNISDRNNFRYRIQCLIENVDVDVIIGDDELTLLHIVCLFGDVDLVKMVLARNPNINEFDKNGYTALHYAILNDNLEVVNLLIANRADVNILTDQHKQTALHLAGGANANLDIIRILLDNGVEPNTKDIMGETALYPTLANSGNLDILRLLIEHGIDINSIDIKGNTILHLAALFDNVEDIIFLIKNGCNPLAINLVGETPADIVKDGKPVSELSAQELSILELFELMSYTGISVNNFEFLFRVFVEGRTDLIKFSIIKGRFDSLSTFRYPKNGNTIIHVAAFRGDCELLKDLLKRGMNVNIRNAEGDTPFHLAAKSVSNNRMKILKILLDHGFNINIKNNLGRNALHFLITNYDQSIFKLFIENGIDINAVDNNGVTPLSLAFADDGSYLIYDFIENGADLNVKDEKGNYIIHKVLRSDSFNGTSKFNLIKILLKKKVEINVVDEYGNSPLHIAASQEFFEIVKLLVDNYADTDILNREKDKPSACSSNYKISKYLEKYEKMKYFLPIYYFNRFRVKN